MHFFAILFGHVKKKQYFCTRFSKNTIRMVPQYVNQRSVCGLKSVAQYVALYKRRARSRASISASASP